MVWSSGDALTPDNMNISSASSLHLTESLSLASALNLPSTASGVGYIYADSTGSFYIVDGSGNSAQLGQ